MVTEKLAPSYIIVLLRHNIHKIDVTLVEVFLGES